MESLAVTIGFSSYNSFVLLSNYTLCFPQKKIPDSAGESFEHFSFQCFFKGIDLFTKKKKLA